jgi:hypothetical protein
MVPLDKQSLFYTSEDARATMSTEKKWGNGRESKDSMMLHVLTFRMDSRVFLWAIRFLKSC